MNRQSYRFVLPDTKNAELEQDDYENDAIELDNEDTSHDDIVYEEASHDHKDTCSPFIRSGNLLWYTFQELLNEKYTTPLIINCQAHQKKPPSQKDTLAIFNFVVQNHLSNEQIDNLLNVMNGIIKRGKANIPLVSNHTSIRRQCSDGIISQEDDGVFRLLTWKYSFINDIFPLEQEKFIYAYSYDIKQIISEALLNIDPKKFVCKPDIRYSKRGHRIFEEYTTGYHFEKLSKAVKKENINNTAVAIGITLDDTLIYSGKRTLTPVYIFIPNCIDEAFQMHLLGFAPSDQLLHDKRSIENHLYETYPKYKKENGAKRYTGKMKIADDLLKFHERKFQRDYLYDILKPILETQKEAVLLRVGRFDNPKGYEINASIHLCIISGDNLQLEYLTSTNFKIKDMKCRMCMSTNCQAIDPNLAIGAFRDDQEMQTIGSNYQAALIQECKRTAHQRTPEINDCYEEGKRVGIKAGYNKLIDLFKFQYDHKISGFFQSLAPDYLHTVVKGLIEAAISWTVCCLHAIAIFDPAKYSNNVSTISARIKVFPITQSLVIFPNKPFHRWSSGIMHLFKDPANKDRAHSTGFFASGSIEAWKLPQLLFQLIFCINEQVCPFSIWNPSTSKKLKHKWNIGRVIINSLVSVMELHFCGRMKVLTQTAIESKLTEVIRNARAHMSLFRLLKQDLITDLTIKVDKGDTGIKSHLIAHIPHCKLTFGADTRTTDTELSELEHKAVKKAHDGTNKQYTSQAMDTLKHKRIQTHTEHRCRDSIDSSESTPESSKYYYCLLHTFGAPDILKFDDGMVRVLLDNKKSTGRINQKYMALDNKTSPDSINQILMTFADAMKRAEDEKDNDFAQCWQSLKKT